MQLPELCGLRHDVVRVDVGVCRGHGEALGPGVVALERGHVEVAAGSDLGQEGLQGAVQQAGVQAEAAIERKWLLLRSKLLEIQSICCVTSNFKSILHELLDTVSYVK